MKLRLSPHVQQDIRAAGAWWKSNRPGAPALFVEELRRAFAVLETTPASGSPALDFAADGIRRLYLERTRYFVYYSVNGEVVEVLRLWHASRGASPKL